MKVKIPKTLQKVIPKWTKKILKRETFDELEKGCIIDDQYIDIGHYNTCMVGEARSMFKVKSHDAESYNDCSECYLYSMSFNRIITGEGWNIGSTIENFENEMQDFDKHLREAHPEIIEQVEKEVK